MKKILIAALAVFILGACGKDKDKKTEGEKKPRSVRYVIAENHNKDYRRVFSGNIISETESKIGFRVDGTIAKKYFKLGEYVKKGQLLAELDDENYKLDVENARAQYESSRANLAEAEAQLKSAQASFSNAKNEFSRIEKLYYDDNVSKSDYDEAKANRDVAEAQLDQYEAYRRSAESNLKASGMQLDQSRLKLSYTRIVAPQDGYIASEDSEVNETVAPGTSVYTITFGEELDAGTYIPENMIGLFKRGEKVQVEVSAVPGKVYRGEIKEIGSSSKGYGRSFPLKVRLLEKDEFLKPGMSAKITFEFAQNGDSKIVLPMSALDQDHSDKKYVYLVTDVKDGLGIIKKAVVNIGKTYADGVEIVNGINSGDYVVISGVSQIAEGQKVAIYLKEEN